MSQNKSDFSKEQREQASKAITAQLYRSQCPDATALNHYCAGLLSSSESSNIASHIQECPLCAEDIAHIRHTLENVIIFPAPEN